MPTLYTVGHSIHPLDEFLALLKAYQITHLVDIRSFAGSRRMPWFNQENLAKVLPENKIAYIHIRELGGLRKPNKDSNNTAWKKCRF